MFYFGNTILLFFLRGLYKVILLPTVCTTVEFVLTARSSAKLRTVSGAVSKTEILINSRASKASEI